MAGTRNTRAKAAPETNTSGSELSPAPSDTSIVPPTRTQGRGLQFAQDLTWRAGRPIAVGELIKRLQSLANELRDMDQEEDENVKQTFTKVAKELASEQLLAHKDRGVRAWVASCAVDVLRLCAPDAPFTERELKVSDQSPWRGSRS
jgi:sister chromatid cohesion protein PDS5